ncbi:MAG: DNA internalization-related competence protein ComEC/Rec2 [Steroidobacteraceae bacterium]
MTALLAFGLLAGVLAALGAQAQGFMPVAGPWLAGAASLALLLLCAPVLRRWRKLQAPRALAALICGFLLVWWQVSRYEQQRLPEQFEQRVLSQATIEGVPVRRGAECYFTAQLLAVGPVPAFSGSVHAALRWSGAPELHAGERWQLLTALHAPAQSANPGSADGQALNLRLRRHASGQVIASPLNRALPGATRPLDYWRERIGLRIAALVSERDTAALIIGLAIGDTQRVSVEQWRVFNANGITHLIAISGLHVTLFCVLASAVMAALWRRVGFLQTRVSRSSCAALFGLGAAGIYALLAGWSVPTQRTLLMLAAWHGLQMFSRPRRATRVLAAGLIGVLCLDPLAPLAAGFWLSFLAVTALLLGGAVAGESSRGWRGLLHEQGLVAVALLPATLAVFGSVSLAGLLVNLLAIPFFSFLLVPLILAATLCLGICPPLALALLRLCAWLIGLAWPLLQGVADSPMSLWHADPARWWFALAALAVFMVILPWPGWMRASAALALLPLLAPPRAGLASGSFAATVFDVGGGEATLLRTAHHALLFDDGEVWGSAGIISATRLVPALHYYHIATLDRLVLPRLDADRGAGAAALNAALTVHEFYAGGSRAAPVEFHACVAGQRWQWDGVEFETLDEVSCALRVATANSELLLPGSASAATQRARLVPQLVQHPGRTSVALIPGHGSRSAYSASLPEALQPQLVILSAPVRAPQRATVAATLRAWTAGGAQLRITGRDGALELQFQPSGRVLVAQWRKP